MRSQLLILLRILCLWWDFFWLSSDFSVFWHFDYDVSWCGFFLVILLEFIELLGCIKKCFHQIWGVFGHCFFRYSFCFFPFLLEFPECMDWYSIWSFTGLWSSVYFSLIIFSVFFRLVNVLWAAINCTAIFLCQLRFVAEPL